MILCALLLFVCEFVQILGRPQAEIKQTSWENFLLPRVLKADEHLTINVTVNRTTTEMMEISLMAASSDNEPISTEDYIFTFKANIIERTVDMTYKELDGEYQTHSTELEQFLDDKIDSTDSSLFITVQFKRRRLTTSSDEKCLEVSSSTYLNPFLIHDLENMEYIRFNGNDAKVNNIIFGFV